MTISPKGLGAEIYVSHRGVWMGSHAACLNMPEDISYAPAVISYSSTSGIRFLYPLNPDMAVQMRDRLRALADGRAKPKSAGERYLARKSAKGLTFVFDDPDAGIHVADSSVSLAGLGPDAVGSLSFKSAEMDGVECVAFTREEFSAFVDILTRALEAYSS